MMLIMSVLCRADSAAITQYSLPVFVYLCLLLSLCLYYQHSSLPTNTWMENITFLWPFRKNLVGELIPKSFFPHSRFVEKGLIWYVWSQ